MRTVIYREGYMCARRMSYEGQPSWQEFDDHLFWRRRPTRFLSFGTWGRAMRRRQQLESEGQRDIVLIAVWVKDLAGVYSAEEVACRLGYSDTGPDHRRRLSPHRDEYLVEGGIAADEYRILAVFKGGGPERNVVFACRSYQITTAIPRGFFPGQRLNNALEDIEDEIYSHSGIRDITKRDELVKAITGSFQLFPIVQYR
ncbi:hypothetical protein V6Z98_003329 [Aspergillus fumigatus]